MSTSKNYSLLASVEWSRISRMTKKIYPLDSYCKKSLHHDPFVQDISIQLYDVDEGFVEFVSM